ncbi:MAG: hypothetical protein ACE5LU_20700 [Anaerolineae bacterium]
MVQPVPGSGVWGGTTTDQQKTADWPAYIRGFLLIRGYPDV